MNGEYILCAAIWYKDLKGDVNIPLNQRLPINCDRGMVFCGHRHLYPMRTMNAIYGISSAEAGESEQGFLTNFNRFVDRDEAGEIAYKAGQIPKAKHLFSEDLY